MLARLHFQGPVDARDIEFGRYGDLVFYIIDFNQVCSPVRPKLRRRSYLWMRSWRMTRHDDRLYSEFKSAYLAACPDEAEGLDQVFIQAIERKQVEKDEIKKVEKVDPIFLFDILVIFQ
ncbi:hypothetical protein GGX14DRAFT_670800 [Mycena pura]|uniref:Uncharacterized protein n=1 Tax=Mycena pura TaxID=153505 RepID=A0AAD6YI85_9AGAR|nr:hypothetical protein GGX14DRAFT_670800 [Mycena pura]